MCGLVGILGGNAASIEGQYRLEQMKKALSHRGPDGEGTYKDPDQLPLLLGHQRLAIIDPNRGQQPMLSADGQIAVTFNGAIYNFLELRKELISRGHPIHSASDTEVLLYAYLEWSEQCVEKFQGMFAFAIWDRRKKLLFCARDRLGIKPFYYYFDGTQLLFASEIKALIASGLVTPKLNTAGLQDYITFQFCLNEKTLFKEIHKLEPGHLLVAQLDGQNIHLQNRQYWDLHYNIDEKKSEAYFTERLSVLLKESVQQHLRSDVPIGAHLSGGIDSSAVVCLAAPFLTDHQFKTFTGAFQEGPQFDETQYAKIVAKAANAHYHQVYIPSDEFATILPKLIYAMDEPVAGPGLIPQYYVSKLAAEHVKVVLGGQGGDETYVGYARYFIAYLEKSLKAAILQTPAEKFSVHLEQLLPHLSLLKSYEPTLRHFWQEGLFGEEDDRYFRLIDRSEGMRHLFDPAIFENYSSRDAYKKIFNREGLHSIINRMTYFDLKASLPALLHVEDRTSMAVSLESRVPLLDHRLIEFMATVPPHIKFANGQMKHLFKKAIEPIVPEPILSRTDKMGFPVPLNQWFQGQAKTFVTDILFSQRARERGIYNIAAIEKIYHQEKQFGRVIWGLLCLELWFQTYIDGAETIAFSANTTQFLSERIS